MRFSRHFLMVVPFAALFFACAGCGRRDGSASPALQLAKAWDEFRLSEYKSAIGLFESVASDSAAGPLQRQEAIYGLAEIWRTRLADTDVNKARRLYDKAIQISPTSDLAAWSHLALARMRHVAGGDAPFLAGVFEAYETVAGSFPDHPAGEEAYLHVQALRLCRQSSNDALRVQEDIGQFLKDRPRSPYRSVALGLKAYTHEMMGQHAERLKALIDSLDSAERDPLSPYVDFSGSYWTIAAVAEFDVGDFVTARRYYRQLVEEYPTDMRVFMARQALARLDRIEGMERARTSGRGP